MSTTQPDQRVTTYQPTVATTEFAALFPIFDNDDIAVVHNGEPRTDFTVTATYSDGVSNDAKVHFASGLIGKVMLVGERAPRRQNRFGAGPIPARDLNLAFDTVQGEMQEARRDIGRSLLSPIGSQGFELKEGNQGDFLIMGPDRTIIPSNPPDGAGNMNTATYDPQGRAEDIFAHLDEVDGKISALMPSLVFDFGAKGDGVNNDSAAVTAASSSTKITNGQGLTYLINALPLDFGKFRNCAFLFDGKVFRTDDYLDVTKYRVTKTLLYTDWTQDKACQFEGAWILPFQLAHGHTYDTTRIAWSWSFDKGQTWQEPEIILDKHPSSPTLGWNCFSAGVIGNRFVMFAEERQESNSALVRVIMRDILLDRTYYRSNGIALTAGSSIATISVPSHGLIMGDQVNFSGVSGTDVAGLSGQKSVYAVLDKDRFQVDKGSASASNQSSTGGSSWILAHTYYNNVFRETVLDNAMLQNGAGQMPTHIHSFTVKDAANGEFFIGFHNGSSSPREVGVIHVQSFFGTPTFVKRRIPSAFEGSAAEPCLRYRAGRLHLTTRGQSAGSEGSSFGYSDNDGVAWAFYRFPGNLHYSPLPFEFYNGEAFIFGSERGENEWNAGSPDNRYNINRPRSFMLRVSYAELVAGNFSNLTTTLLGYEIYQGEQVSSGVGVGSTLLDEEEGKLIYAFSSEDMRSSTRYSLNFPSVDNEFLGQGYQPDVYAYEISLKKPRAGNIGYELRGPDLQTLPVYKQGNTRRIEGPLRIVGDMTVAATLTASKLISGDTEFAVNERVCPTAVAASASLVLPAGYSVYKITPPVSGSGAVNVTAIARAGTKEGDVITLATASAGDAVIINNTGFFRIGANRSLSSIAKVLTLQRAPSSYWHCKSFADN